MSAYICEKNHFVYLIKAACSRQISKGYTIGWAVPNSNPLDWRQIDPSDSEQCAEVANMLLRENIASVSFRYPNDRTSATLPGAVMDDPITAADFYGMPWDAFNPVQVLKAINCLEYQSCEHPGWETSEAKAFLDTLTHHAISALPGYDEAEWGPAMTLAERRAAVQLARAA